jgi:hypothetical protein
MGIRFFCPNGHKLNVKEFQRGLTGICPRCGARVHIPLTSTRRSSRSKKSRSRGGVADSQVIGVDAGIAAPPPGAAVLGSVAVGSDVAAEPPSPFSVFAASAGSYPAASGNGPDDLPAEEGTWFVRPPSGGQFGPATMPILQTWLAEGRLTIDTLLWREGWPDWRPAREVFRQLSSRPAMSATADLGGELDEAAASRPAATGRTRPRNPHAVAIGMMILVSLCLSLALLAVLLKIF